jgi:hypothetical protein
VVVVVVVGVAVTTVLENGLTRWVGRGTLDPGVATGAAASGIVLGVANAVGGAGATIGKGLAGIDRTRVADDATRSADDVLFEAWLPSRIPTTGKTITRTGQLQRIHVRTGNAT